MAVGAVQGARRIDRRWLALLGLSVVFHAVVLGAFAFRLPPIAFSADAETMDVTLVPPAPFIRPTQAKAADAPAPTRVVVIDTPPRASASVASTGEASDALDLFGPVFADGMWPRPVLVSSEPCDPKADPEREQACRRELLLIGLASDAASGANARP